MMDRYTREELACWLEERAEEILYHNSNHDLRPPVLREKYHAAAAYLRADPATLKARLREAVVGMHWAEGDTWEALSLPTAERIIDEWWGGGA